jgi:hypothetical protein
LPAGFLVSGMPLPLLLMPEMSNRSVP